MQTGVPGSNEATETEPTICKIITDLSNGLNEIRQLLGISQLPTGEHLQIPLVESVQNRADIASISTN